MPSSMTLVSSPCECGDYLIRRSPSWVRLKNGSLWKYSNVATPLFLYPPSQRLMIEKCPNPIRDIAYCRGCTYQRKCWG